VAFVFSFPDIGGLLVYYQLMKEMWNWYVGRISDIIKN